MELFIFWFALSVLAGMIAGNKGRSGFGFFLLALLLSPLIGIIAAAVATPNVKNIESARVASGDSKKCAYCAELIKAEAIVCRFCGKEVESTVGESAKSST